MTPAVWGCIQLPLPAVSWHRESNIFSNLEPAAWTITLPWMHYPAELLWDSFKCGGNDVLGQLQDSMDFSTSECIENRIPTPGKIKDFTKATTWGRLPGESKSWMDSKPCSMHQNGHNKIFQLLSMKPSCWLFVEQSCSTIEASRCLQMTWLKI